MPRRKNRDMVVFDPPVPIHAGYDYLLIIPKDANSKAVVIDGKTKQLLNSQ